MARRHSYLLFAVLVLAAFPINTAGATVWGDTFKGTVIDTLNWEISAPLGASTVTQKNALLLTSDGTGGEFCNTPEPLGPGAGIALRKRLAGDFDIQVDFRNFSAPFCGLTQAFLNVYQDPFNKLHIKRQRFYHEDSIQTISVVNGEWLDGTFSPIQTTSGATIPNSLNNKKVGWSDAHGTFRITRTGKSIETLINGVRHDLIEAAFDGPVIVSLVLLGPGLEAGMASVAFDNFVIHSGTLLDPILVCPPLAMSKADTGVLWMGSLVPCSPEICGGAEQNRATLALEKGDVTVLRSGLVRIKLHRLTIRSTGEIAGNKTLTVLGVSFTGNDTFDAIYGLGSITTDSGGNFVGTTDLGDGVPFAFASGATVSAQFVLNDPDVRSEFITGFTVP